jgi:dihydroxy-acid dehydratase
VLTTGCDKTTPACLMAAATVNLPAIVLSGGPMLNGYVDGRRAGSGLIIWQSRRLLAAGQIDYAEFMDRVSRSAPSAGHCNTMGTALSMNSIAEALGMTLPGCAAIPAPYRERAHVAYETGFRALEMVRENLTPRKIMTREAFENAIMVASAIAMSTNCPIHVNAIARHTGVELTNDDWERVGGDIPILANCAAAGDYLGEDFHHAGGVPAVMHALLAAGRLHADAVTVNGRTVRDNVEDAASGNPDVISDYDKPFGPRGGVLVLHGNLFSSGMMKMSVITEDLRAATHRADPAGSRRHPDPRRRPAEWHGGCPVHPQPQPRGRGRRQPRDPANRRSHHPRRPQPSPRRRAQRRGDRRTVARTHAADVHQPDPVATAVPRPHRPDGHRQLPRVRRRLPGHHRHEGNAP